MARYFALTSRGLVDALRDELADLGAKELVKQPGGVFFDGNWSVVMRANLRLRTATRIVKPILTFPAYKNEDLYGNIRKFDFTKLIDNTGTLAVEASVRDCAFKDQRFVAMKVKDAIVDQFREKTGARPSVDTENPDLIVVIRGFKNHFEVSLDTSGEALFKRGYRVATGDAPIKEHVAAGLLMLAEWDRATPIVDPMCGSGTILIEAAMMAKRMAPGTLRKSFGFMKWKGYDRTVFEKELDSALELEEKATESLMTRLKAERAKDLAQLGESAGSLARDEDGTRVKPLFYGYDIDAKVIKAAKDNAREAGVDDICIFRRHAMETLEAPVEKGYLITNPPYGERLGSKEALKDTYKDLAFTLKNRFKGWSAFVLSGDPELSSSMKLKAARKSPVWNGNIECRLLRYDIF